MRLTVANSLLLCGLLCTGCETLSKTGRNWPGKTAALTEQLATDQQRREAADKQIAQGSSAPSDTPTIQKTNFPPSGDATSTLMKAKQAEQARQNQVAKGLYQQVLEQQPQNAEAHHRLGVIADQDGRYPEAQQHYQMALQQQPQNASLLSDIGYSLYSQDRLDEAEQYLAAALQLQPENQYARNNLAQVYGRRAQQTGSPADYKLAQEQFAMALGPQGAEQQMQQLFPQAAPPAAERRELPNPFKRKPAQAKSRGRNGSQLEAPNVSGEEGNAELLRQMERVRAEMIANGELPAKGAADTSAQRPPANAPPRNVPFDQMNNVLSSIDQEAASRQSQALRKGYPMPPRSNSRQQPGWESSRIEQAGGTNQPNPSGNGQPYHEYQDSAVTAQNQGFHSSMPMIPGGPESPAGRGEFANGNYGPPGGAPNPGVNGQYAAPPRNSSDPTASNDWNQDSSAMSQSWPDRAGAPTQFDARGQNWDGRSLMNNPSAGPSGNLAYEQSDPTYNSGTGRGFGPQRPGPGQGPGQGPTNARGQGNPAGWDDGRQTAAQLGLDAGMGDMFPGGAGDMGTDWNQRGNGVYHAGGDAGMYGNPANDRGAFGNGNRNVAPADYNSPQSGYENPGYSDSAWGQNRANAPADSTAPWNQPATNPRNGRGGPASQYGGNSQPRGRFAPSRQSPAAGQEFGGPPIYYDR